MNYKEATNYILESLPMFQRIGNKAYKADLSNAEKLDEYFGHQHKQIRTIHVAGTNGKGSVSHMLASVMQAAGYRTGLFTSPHLIDFRERIRVNGKIIHQKYITRFIEENKVIFDEIKPSFFEMSVFLAFSYFVRQKVDVAIFEVGLGGRLDTTNIITPEISLITNIGLDHTQILGSTIASIANEKAGIIKQGIPVIIGESDEESRPVFEKKAKDMHSEIIFSDDLYNIEETRVLKNGKCESLLTKCPDWNLKTLLHDLCGLYQQKNIGTVLAALKVLREKKIFDVQPRHLTYGLENVVENTGLQGRWQIVKKNPLLICDTAHNEHGFREIIRQINCMDFARLYMVLGFVEDKNIDSIIDLLPVNARYFLCEASVPRAMKIENLEKIFQQKNLDYTKYNKVVKAVKAAIAEALSNDMVYVGGSTFVVGDFLNWKKKQNSF